MTRSTEDSRRKRKITQKIARKSAQRESEHQLTKNPTQADGSTPKSRSAKPR